MSFTEKLKALFNETEVEVKEEVVESTESIESTEEVVEEVKVETSEEEVIKEEKHFLDIPYGERMFRVDTDSLEEGSYIFEIVMEENEAGEMVEAIKKVEDGEYSLEDGTVFMVENDTVTKIDKPEMVEEEVVEAEVEAPSEFENEVYSSFERMKNEVELLKKSVEELTKFNEDLKSKVEELEKQPGSEGVTFKKQGFKFNSEKKKTDLDRLKSLSKYRK